VFLSGYSGWGEGQLDAKSLGYWLTHPRVARWSSSRTICDYDRTLQKFYEANHILPHRVKIHGQLMGLIWGWEIRNWHLAFFPFDAGLLDLLGARFDLIGVLNQNVKLVRLFLRSFLRSACKQRRNGSHFNSIVTFSICQ